MITKQLEPYRDMQTNKKEHIKSASPLVIDSSKIESPKKDYTNNYLVDHLKSNRFNNEQQQNSLNDDLNIDKDEKRNNRFYDESIYRESILNGNRMNVNSIKYNEPIRNWNDDATESSNYQNEHQQNDRIDE